MALIAFRSVTEMQRKKRQRGSEKEKRKGGQKKTNRRERYQKIKQKAKQKRKSKNKTEQAEKKNSKEEKKRRTAENVTQKFLTAALLPELTKIILYGQLSIFDFLSVIHLYLENLYSVNICDASAHVTHGLFSCNT